MIRPLRRAALLLLLMLSASGSFAQLTLSLSLAPPYSPYLSEYMTYGNKALLTVVNPGGGSYNMYFRVRVTGDNNVSGQTKTGYKPPMPVVVNAPTTLLRGPDLDAAFNQSNFELKGTTVDDIVKGAGLPEGTYTVCIQAFDYATDQPLSNDACASFNIIYPEAPIATFPLCGDTVRQLTAILPPSFSFAWSPPAPFVTGVRYSFRIVELLPGQEPNATVMSSPGGFTVGPLMMNSLPNAQALLPLIGGKTYAWQVTAFDPAGKQVIRNNGLSPVCWFTYKAFAGYTGPSPDTVFLTTPLCRNYKDKNGASKVDESIPQALANILSYTEEKPLSIGWLWNTQTAAQKSGMDSAAYTTLMLNGVQAANGSNILMYKLAILPVLKSDKSFGKDLITKQQRFELSAKDIAAAGLVPGHYYTVRIQAIGGGGAGATGIRTLSEYTSCEAQLVKKQDSTKYITFTGTLVYKLEDGGAPHPAGKVNLSFGLSAIKQFKKFSSGVHGGPPSATTDAAGRFSIKLPVQKGFEDLGYLAFSVNNAYYMQPDTNQTVALRVMVKGANGQMTKGGLRDSIELGAMPIDARTYTLTVKVGKGFPKFYEDTLSAALLAGNSTYGTSQTYETDNISIKARTRVAAGIPVMIYRYEKDADMPRVEGDTTVPAPAAKGSKVRRKVALGYTAVEKAGAQDERTVVIFKRLLCAMRDDDQYYMQAILPGKSGNSNNPFNAAPKGPVDIYALTASDDQLDAFIEAPEQAFSFKPAMMKTGVTENHFNVTKAYNLISTLPPMSTVSGKLVYTWPGKDVVRPLANKKFVVRAIYTFNGEEGFPSVDGPGCDENTAVYLAGKPTANAGSTAEDVIGIDEDGVVLGVGTTDAQGAFKVNFINYNKKGLLTGNAYAASMGKECPPKEIDHEKAINGKDFVTKYGIGKNGKGPTSVQEIKDAVDGEDWSKVTTNWQEIAQMTGKGVVDYGMNKSMQDMLGNQKDMSDVTGNNAKGAGAGKGNLKSYGADVQFISGYGISATTSGSLSTKTTSQKIDAATVDMPGSGMMKLHTSILRAEDRQRGADIAWTPTETAPGTHGPSDPGPRGEASAKDNGGPKSASMFTVDKAPVSVGRMVVIELLDDYYGKRMAPAGDPGSGRFALDAFEKKDLGTLTTKALNEVSEIKVNVMVPNGKGGWKDSAGYMLSGAKMVLYRNIGEKPAGIPIGEGTEKHDVKPLIQSSVVGEASGPSVEWIVDTGFSPDKSGVFRLEDRHSIVQNYYYKSGGFMGSGGTIESRGNYYIQIAPNPVANLATQFEPVQEFWNSNKISLYLREGKIAGRVTIVSGPASKDGKDKGAPHVKVRLVCGSCNGLDGTKAKADVYLYTDDYGYFEYVKGAKGATGAGFTWDDKAQQRPSLYAAPELKGYNVAKTETQKVPLFGEQTFYTLQLYPASTVSGVIRGEDNKDAIAYIMMLPDTMLKVSEQPAAPGNGSKFSLAVPSETTIRLAFIAQDPAYFDDTLEFKTGPSSTNKDLGTIRLPQRLHRMRFAFQRVSSTGAVKTGSEIEAGLFKVVVNGDEAGARYNNLNEPYVQVAFANVSVNNYNVVVTDAKGKGYIPQVLNVSNKESKYAQTYNVTMRQGDSISGTVTFETKNGANYTPSPANNIRVYIDHDDVSGAVKADTGWSTLEAVTGNDGKYIIRGIPHMAKTRVRAVAITKSYSVAVNGGDTTVQIGKAGSGATVNFNLKRACECKLTEIYRLPFQPESIVQDSKNKDKYTVSGFVDLAYNSTGFNKIDAQSKAYLEEAKFIRKSTPQGDSLVPEASELSLVQTTIKMKYKNRYNVALNGGVQYGPIDFNGKGSNAPIPVPLKVTATAGGGVVYANTRIVDNSYNYPSTYLDFGKTGEFYLAQKTTGGMVTTIPAIALTKPAGDYHLTDKGGKPLLFQFIGFDATAKPDSSYIDDKGRIHLNTAFRATVPNAQPGFVDIRIPDLILDEAKISPATFTNPLRLKLDNWDVDISNWSVDPSKGGLYAENSSVIHTGVTDIKMGLFNLRHDKFVLLNPDLKQMYLSGGLIKLKDISTNAALVYDLKTGSDLGAHWRLSISGDGAAPAARFDLKTDYALSTLEVAYLQIISYNNESIVSLKNIGDLSVGNNPYIHFKPNSIGVNNDNFLLVGDATFDVPRLGAATLKLQYSGTGKKSGDLAIMKQDIAPFGLSFDAPGYTKFTSDDKGGKNENGITTFNGTIEEPGVIGPLACKFSFGKNGGYDSHGLIELTDKKVKLDPDGNTMLNLASLRDAAGVMRNGLEVAAGYPNADWSKLRLCGSMQQTKDVVLKEDPKALVDFTVHGAIEANANEISASDIATPFGALKMTCNLKTGDMLGAMRMNEVAFGSYTFSGDVEVGFGKSGMLTMAAGQLNTGTLLAEGFGLFKVGLILGNYKKLPASAIAKTVQYSKDPQAHCWLDANSTKFTGLYFTGGWDVISVQKGFDVGIAQAYFNASLGVEVAIGMNFPAKAYALNLGAHGEVTAGLSAITGTSIKGQLRGDVTAGGAYTGSSFALTGTASLGVQCEVCQSIPFFDDLCFDFKQDAGAIFYSTSSPKKADFSFTLDPYNSSECGPSK